MIDAGEGEGVGAGVGVDVGAGGAGASAGFSDKGEGVDGDGFTDVGAVSLATQPPANNTKMRKTIIPIDNTLFLISIVPPSSFPDAGNLVPAELASPTYDVILLNK